MHRRGWRVFLAAWILWSGAMHGDTVVWRPLQGFPARAGVRQTAQARCEVAREAFQVSHPDLGSRLRCLPHGLRPEER